MIRIMLIMSLVLALLSISPLASSNAFFVTNAYETVYVKSGDTVWKIAANYATDKDDVREIVCVIKQLNRLNNNAQVYPGQALKVPVKNYER